MNPVLQQDPIARAFDLIERRWVLEIVRYLADGPERPQAMRSALGVSAESIRLALARMVEEGLLIRTKLNEFPIRVDYELTDRGRGLLPVIRELEKWAAFSGGDD
jgi:DNA-binding HxlR family transcriptional regulator